MARKLIVTHHAPDLDAIGATWLLKRFDTQHYGDAHVTFVDPGSTITLEAAEEFGCQLHEVTHVDTGLGEFDHHQPERGQQRISATSLVYEHVCRVHPDLADDKSLSYIVEFITDVDHFGEVNWPDASSKRYLFMIHELIRGMEFTDPHNDDSQLHFGMKCLENVYAVLNNRFKAEESIQESGQQFELPIGQCLAIETRNDDTIKIAQKMGYALVVRKDPEAGNIRVKVRPDVELDLKALADKIMEQDKKGTWYYHPSGKMLLNGSVKHRHQTASPLTLNQVVALIKETYHD